MLRVFETLMNVLYQEPTFWGLNISYQLSTVAMLSLSNHCFSMKRKLTSDTDVADTDMTQEVLSLGKWKWYYL